MTQSKLAKAAPASRFKSSILGKVHVRGQSLLKFLAAGFAELRHMLCWVLTAPQIITISTFPE